MPEEHYDFTPQSRLMQADEIETLARIFVNNGINKIRLTGGEPLIRKDAKDIILRLSKLPVKLALTTNGTRLHDYINLLQEAGISSLNISLDTLNADTFMLLTRRDQFAQVKANIDLALSKGFDVKINMVVMKTLNEREINNFVEWTKDAPLHVRFIEFMPFSGNRWTSNKVVTLHEILNIIKEKYEINTLPQKVHDTAKLFSVKNYKGDFGIISTMSAPFCSGCNRIRLTADGKIKNCLFSEEEIDLLSALRKGDDVSELIHKNINSKAKELGGQFTADINNINAKNIHNRSMITIGG
jgi:cyclic pyranopterin phosphate synthase